MLIAESSRTRCNHHVQELVDIMACQQIAVEDNSLQSDCSNMSGHGGDCQPCIVTSKLPLSCNDQSSIVEDAGQEVTRNEALTPQALNFNSIDKTMTQGKKADDNEYSS
jgi:hypothetical protein